MKTLHILLKDRLREIRKEVPDDFNVMPPQGITPEASHSLVFPDLFVNLSEVAAMWTTEEE